MTFNGWAVNLNGVILATCDTQAAWDELDCFPGEVFDVLTDVPAGLDIPSLRTEDVTYPQRDGVKHFSDWYQPRIITLVGTFGPISTDECTDGSCQTVREQLQAAAQEWKRTCCDTELVVYTDCYLTDHAENYNPPNTDGEWTTIGENLAPNPSAETEQAWVNDLAGTHTATWDVIDYYAGSKSRKSVKDSGASPLVLSLSEVGATTADDVMVLNGLTYTFSVWLMAPQAGYVGTVEVEWSFDSSTTTSVDVALPAGVWTRVNVTGVCPGDGTADVRAFIGTADASPATVGHAGYADALLVEQSALLADYYDGDTPDVYDTATESWWQFTWVGTANESTTLKQDQPATFHGSTVNGPFGIVGRPREFKYKQQYRNDQVYDFVARFDAVDQRMYVLDECGTPGYSECVNIDPGSQLFSICMTDGVCFDGAGFCFTNVVENGGSVAPTEVSVAGTELVYPTITLYPELVDPTIENITTGEWVSFDGTIGDLPVTINTEEGTAFDSEGSSLTHLLRGSLFMSMEPGNYEWRLLSSGEDIPEPGYASLCFRPTVVAA